MTNNINEPSLHSSPALIRAHIPRDSQQGIIRKLNEDLTYFRGENLRLLEQINQLKQAIAALNKEPTNSL
jgi:hypothetical protein